MSNDWPEAGAVKPRQLERQLKWLVDQGFVGVTFCEAVVSPPEGKVVAVTFDDGYRSVLESALPVLSRLGLPGTLFVPTDFVDKGCPLKWAGLERWIGGPYDRELTPVSWRELRELATAGWEIGSHSCTHADLTRVDDARLRTELERSREACESAVGSPCHSLAYPYGAADARVVLAAREAGYLAAGLLSWRLPPGQPLAWPRIGIFRRDGFVGFRMKISTMGRRLRTPRAWDVLQPSVDRVRQHLR